MKDCAVAIVGTGVIGQSWAIAFLRAGCRVRLFDDMPGVAAAAMEKIRQTLVDSTAGNLPPGMPIDAVLAHLECAESLDEVVAGVVHVQENTPERLELKQRVFAALDEITGPDAVIASSTSALLPSSFMAGLRGSHRCLVAHPLNPPHLIPAVEIVPSPETSYESLIATQRLLTSIGQKPVILKREIEGFIMNRLQGALLDEAFLLFARGYASIEDIDTAMCDGLARRWAFMGPFETIDLNAPGGVANFIARYGAAYAEIGRERPGRVAWTGELAEAVIAARRSVLSESDLPTRAAWRDARLAAIAAHMQSCNDEET